MGRALDMTSLSLTYPIEQPPGCLTCPYHLVGQGFAPDWVPANPRIAFLAEAAGETEMIERGPLLGATGRMFFHTMLNPLGLTRDDVLLANTLRCHPPENEYPIGQMRKDAEKACRQWDGVHLKSREERHVDITAGGINGFNPNYFLITVHPSFVNRTWSMLRVAKADIEKALRLSQVPGRKLLVLMGEKPMSLVHPDLDGGVIKWRGHHGPLDWQKFQERF